jgi:hypothetical protein
MYTRSRLLIKQNTRAEVAMSDPSATGILAIIGHRSTEKANRTIEIVREHTGGDEPNGITPDIRILVKSLSFGIPYKEMFPHSRVHTDAEYLLQMVPRVSPHLNGVKTVSIDGHNSEKLLIVLHHVISSRDVTQLICSFLPSGGADGTTGTLMHNRIPWMTQPTFSQKIVIVFDGVNMHRSEKIRNILFEGRHRGMSIAIVTMYSMKCLPSDLRPLVEHTIHMEPQVGPGRKSTISGLTSPGCLRDIFNR